MHPILHKRPVARFYYTGSHTHPVRRTVLLIETKPDYIRGYELREGGKVREFKDAPIKTYTRSRIAPATPYERRKTQRLASVKVQLPISDLPCLIW